MLRVLFIGLVLMQTGHAKKKVTLNFPASRTRYFPAFPVMARYEFIGLVLVFCIPLSFFHSCFHLLVCECGLQTCYEDEMPLLGAVNEPHWGQTRIDVVPGRFFCISLFFPNYKAFFYLFKLKTYYYYEILPPQVANESRWSQAMTDVVCSGKFFFVSFLFLFFFQLIIILSFSSLLRCSKCHFVLSLFHSKHYFKKQR
jgi:hypothetical protein